MNFVYIKSKTFRARLFKKLMFPFKVLVFIIICIIVLIVEFFRGTFKD